MHFRRHIALRLFLLLLFGAELVMASSFHTGDASPDLALDGKATGELMSNIALLMEEVSPEERDGKSHNDILVTDLQTPCICTPTSYLPQGFWGKSCNKTEVHLYTLHRALLI